jgi:hypothetical protein
MQQVSEFQAGWRFVCLAGKEFLNYSGTTSVCFLKRHKMETVWKEAT